MSTLLEKFISNKLAAYTEPTRKRVPKGHKIGFPLSKFHASLLCLTVTKGEAIAAAVGVSHTQVRVWKTEPGFKLMVKKNAEEFAGVFVNYLIDIGREVYAFPQVLAKRSFPYKSKIGEEREFIFADKYAIRLYQPPLIYRNILDIRSYQPFLVVLIVQKLLTAKMPKEIEMYVHSLMWYVLRAFGHDKDPGLESQVIPFKRSVERVLDEAMQLVLKPNLTDGERQQVLILLTTLKLIL